jgi:transcriptional regulator with GAF, ATPase, and Fis domain
MLGVTEPRKPASRRPGQPSGAKRPGEERGKPSTPAVGKAVPAASATPPDKSSGKSPGNPPTKPPTQPATASTPGPKVHQRLVPQPPDPKVQAAVVEALSGAVARISQAAASDEPLAEVMRKVLEEMRDAMNLQRAVLALREGGSGELRGRLAVGERAAFVQSAFRVPMGDSQDLFSVLCRQAQDSLIIDTSDPVIAARLPRWYGEHVRAPTFVLLPMNAGSRPIGLLYGDRAEAGSLNVGEKELTLLKALRNQLVMAVRLRSGG